MGILGDNRKREGRERMILTVEQAETMERTRRFVELLRKPAIITYLLMGIILFFWLFSLAIGAQSDPAGLVRMGAKINWLIEQGQTWRLLSPAFLHFGILHLLFNGYALYILGRMIENLYGRRRFFILFTVSAVASILASYWATERMSVGASGAIFGLLGAGAVVGYKHREEIPPTFRRFFGGGMLPWIALNLAFGFIVEGIDNYAHTGGLIAGALVAVTMEARIGKANRSVFVVDAFVTLLFLLSLALTAATLGAMTYNMMIDDSLDPPKKWKQVRDDAMGVVASVPAALENVNQPQANANEGYQFIDKHLGFWLAFELDRMRSPSYEELSEILMRDLEASNDIAFNSVQILTDEKSMLSGRQARHIKLSFSLQHSSDIVYILDMRLLSTPSGVVSVACSAPKRFFSLYRRWCSHFMNDFELKKGL